jgi:hypothetical protein
VAKSFQDRMFGLAVANAKPLGTESSDPLPV